MSVEASSPLHTARSAEVEFRMFVRQLLTDVGLAVLLAVPTLALAKPNALPEQVAAKDSAAVDTIAEFAERSAARQPRLLS